MVLQEHPSGCVDLHVAVTRGVDLQAEAEHGGHTWQSGASTAEKCSADCVHAIRGVGRSAQTLFIGNRNATGKRVLLQYLVHTSMNILRPAERSRCLSRVRPWQAKAEAGC